MNINITHFSTYAVFFFRERVIPSLTAQQEKIIIIASVSFGCLAASYLVYHFCLKSENNVQKSQKMLASDAVKERKRQFDIIGKLKNRKFENGIQNGKGKRTEFGIVAEGDLKDGKLNGQGKKTFTMGRVEVEEGKFVDDKLHGQGKRTKRNGKIEEGLFEDGVLKQPKN